MKCNELKSFHKRQKARISQKTGTQCFSVIYNNAQQRNIVRRVFRPSQTSKMELWAKIALAKSSILDVW